jgi:hypothetical protein
MSAFWLIAGAVSGKLSVTLRTKRGRPVKQKPSPVAFWLLVRQRKDWADRTIVRDAKNPTLEPAQTLYFAIVEGECLGVANSHIDMLQGNNTDFSFGAVGVRISRTIQTTHYPIKALKKLP